MNIQHILQIRVTPSYMGKTGYSTDTYEVLTERAKMMNETLRRAIAEQFRNTQLGLIRIKKNLGMTHLSDSETEEYVREILLSTPLDAIEKKGKNYYFMCSAYHAMLTVNSQTLTIITAKNL